MDTVPLPIQFLVTSSYVHHLFYLPRLCFYVSQFQIPQEAGFVLLGNHYCTHTNPSSKVFSFISESKQTKDERLWEGTNSNLINLDQGTESQ